MAVIVSAGLPTCMEGLSYPIPFSDPNAVIRIAQHAERLGYHSVWGNDHMTTQRYVRAEFPVPPRFWEPLVTYAFIAANTTTLRLGDFPRVPQVRKARLATLIFDEECGVRTNGSGRADEAHGAERRSAPALRWDAN